MPWIINNYLINQSLHNLLIKLRGPGKLIQRFQSILRAIILYNLCLMKPLFQLCYLCIKPLSPPCQISTPALIYILIQSTGHKLINIGKPLRITFFSVLL